MRKKKELLIVVGSIALCIICIVGGIFLEKKSAEIKRTAQEKPQEVQEIHNVNARDNVVHTDAFQGKPLSKKEKEKLEKEEKKQSADKKEEQTTENKPSKEEGQQTEKPADIPQGEQLPQVEEPGWVTGVY